MKRTSLNSPRHKILVKFLREMRVVRELTQQDLADAMGRPQTYISAVEKGNRGLDMLQIIEFTDAMGTQFSEFALELERRFKKAKV
jgi:transcriptional regulator with XRE-family HTH domain